MLTKENHPLSGCKKRPGRKGCQFRGSEEMPEIRWQSPAAYDEAGADELVFLDITASSDQSSHGGGYGAPGSRSGIYSFYRRWRDPDGRGFSRRF